MMESSSKDRLGYASSLRESIVPNTFGHAARIHRVALRMDDFLTHGFTQQCRRCEAMWRGTAHQAHWERCQDRLQQALASSPQGQVRLSAQTGAATQPGRSRPGFIRPWGVSSPRRLLRVQALLLRHSWPRQRSGTAKKWRICQSEFRSELGVRIRSIDGQPIAPTSDGGRCPPVQSELDPLQLEWRGSGNNHRHGSRDVEMTSTLAPPTVGASTTSPSLAAATGMEMGMTTTSLGRTNCARQPRACSETWCGNGVGQPEASIAPIGEGQMSSKT